MEKIAFAEGRGIVSDITSMFGQAAHGAIGQAVRRPDRTSIGISNDSIGGPAFGGSGFASSYAASSALASQSQFQQSFLSAYQSSYNSAGAYNYSFDLGKP